MSPMQMLFSFEGRMRRRDWWIWTIISAVGGLIYLFALALIVGGGQIDTGLAWVGATLGDPLPQVAVSLVALAPLIWVQAALAAKRTHDRNQTAAPAIVLTVLTTLSNFRPETPDALGGVGPVVMSVMLMLALGGGLYLLVTLGFLDGTQGPNRFGPSPKGIGGEGVKETAEIFS